MNILTGIAPNSELQEATAMASDCQSKYEGLQKRICSQRELVNQLALELRELALARKWLTAESPSDAAAARYECTFAAERFQEEGDLLNAMETAARNARTDVSDAGNRVFAIISQLVASQFNGAVIEGYVDRTQCS